MSDAHGARRLGFAEAQKVILDTVRRLDGEMVQLLEAAGRVLDQDVIAPWNLPRFSNSAMDGYAVRYEDCKNGEKLRITGFLPAGAQATTAVEAGTAIRIMTGAPIPQGCDCVVPFEDAEETDGEVRATGAVKAGKHIRSEGEDVREGEAVLTAGRLLRPAEISLMASCGCTQVRVMRRPRVAIVSTGDELVPLGETPGVAQIVNSNAYSLAAAVQAAGAEAVMLGIARDTKESHLEKLVAALKYDVVITSAGISVGDRDMVKSTLQELGVRLAFERVRVKPGKVMAFGAVGEKLVFGLPGNPVSSMLTFEEFVAPALRKMMGREEPVDRLFTAELAQEVIKTRDVTLLLRVKLERVDGRWIARSAGVQETGLVRTLAEANGVALLPEGFATVAAGTPVQVHWLS
jgi:molybdopterin molybdotransferase